MPVCSLCSIAFPAIRAQRKEEGKSPSRAQICGGFPTFFDCVGAPASHQFLLFPIRQEVVATYKRRNAALILGFPIEGSPEVKSLLQTLCPSLDYRYNAHKLGCRDPKTVYTGVTASLLS